MLLYLPKSVTKKKKCTAIKSDQRVMAKAKARASAAPLVAAKPRAKKIAAAKKGMSTLPKRMAPIKNGLKTLTKHWMLLTSKLLRLATLPVPKKEATV